MARLPDVSSLGARPAVEPAGGVPAVPGGESLRASASALQGQNVIGQEVQNLGAQFAQMEGRIRTRADAVDRAKVFGAFNEEAQSELRRLTTEADLSDLSVTNGYGKFLNDRMGQLLSNHQGSPESKLALQERLDTVKATLLGQAGMMGAEIGEKKVVTMIGENLNTLNNSVQNDPSRFVDMIRVLDADIDDMAPALTPEMEIQLRSVGRKELAKTALNSYIARGAFDEARELLNDTPGLVQMLGPEEQRVIGNRFAEADKAASEARNKGIAARMELAAYLGHEPSMSQLLAFKGIPQAAQTPAQKIAALEKDLGPLTREQKLSVYGVSSGSPQTDARRIIDDREAVRRQYGEDSPQAKAYDELVAGNKGADIGAVGAVRKEFTAQSGDFVKTRDAFSKVAAATPTPAGDMALIFSYMKMLDPTSAVKEGEYATASNAASIPERVRGMYNKAMDGESLTESMRTDFKGQADSIMRAAITKQTQLEDEYRGVAERNKLPVPDVVIDYIQNYRQFGDDPPDNPGGDGDKGSDGKTKKRIRVDLEGNTIGGDSPTAVTPEAPKRKSAREPVQ